MSDRVAQLAAASGIPASSHTAALATWNALVDAARAQWPDVTLDEDEIARFVGPRLVGVDIVSALESIPAGDMALAAACLAQQATAHAAFDALLCEVDAASQAVGASRDISDDVKQLLRVQLLVPNGDKPPGIAGYRGKGSLRGWLRITATRELIRHKKKRQREVSLPPSLEVLFAADSQELQALKAKYRNEFAAALREAIALLSPEDRTLLRQQVAEGLSIDAIGAAFGVHRATAARWLTRARASLVAATHRRLADRLQLPLDEIESAIRFVRSQLDASIVRHLRAHE